MYPCFNVIMYLYDTYKWFLFPRIIIIDKLKKEITLYFIYIEAEQLLMSWIMLFTDHCEARVNGLPSYSYSLKWE